MKDSMKQSFVEEVSWKLVFALGFVLLFQAVTSLVSGAVLFDPLLVEGNMEATLISLSDHFNQAHASVFLDIMTACGIVTLGVIFYVILRQYHKLIATLGLAMYIMEAGLLIVSKLFIFGLIQLSAQTAFTTGQAGIYASKQVLAATLLEVGQFAYSVHIIPFGIGAICFYYLLTKSAIIPKWMSIWGFLTVIIILICVPLMAYGFDIPFVVLLPYVPFEFVSGIYFILRGLRGRHKKTK